MKNLPLTQFRFSISQLHNAPQFVNEKTMSVYTDKTPEQRQRQREQTRAAEKRRMAENPHREMLMNLKAAAATKTNSRKRAIEFDLTETDLAWPTHCPVFGVELH